MNKISSELNNVAKILSSAIKYDEKFIKNVAKNILGKDISEKDAKRAHEVAKRYNDAQDYYDALKDFFLN